uniref:Uncharacterized protein n=1 Tax=Romanomermis culicivorax TaxID=13658 RepID=A0A915I998_ROMCU
MVKFDDSKHTKTWKTCRRGSDEGDHAFNLERFQTGSFQVCQVKDHCFLKDVARSLLRFVTGYYNAEETCDSVFELILSNSTLKSLILAIPNDCNFTRIMDVVIMQMGPDSKISIFYFCNSDSKRKYIYTNKQI